MPSRTPDYMTEYESQNRTPVCDTYTLDELGNWVHLLAKRSQHRSDPERRDKDLYDAQNYLDMMQAKLDSLKA